MSLMATGGGNGETSSFFKLGEIRLAKDSDFQHFRELADSNDGWTQKLDKNGLVVWSKETQSSSIKMMKVWCSRPCSLYGTLVSQGTSM